MRQALWEMLKVTAEVYVPVATGVRRIGSRSMSC